MDVSYQSGGLPGEPPGPPKEPDHLGTFATPVPPPRVVAVEDDSDLLELLREVFTGDGFRVALCRTFPDAVAALTCEPTDLVVTDALLRDRAELPVVRWLDEHPQPLAGIIIITGASSSMMERHAALVSRLAAQVLPKPFEVDDLLEIAHTLTGWPSQP